MVWYKEENHDIRRTLGTVKGAVERVGGDLDVMTDGEIVGSNIKLGDDDIVGSKLLEIQ